MNPRRFTNPRSAGEQRGPTRKTRGWDRLIAAGVAGNGSWRDEPRSPAAKVLVRAFDRVHELPTRGPHRRTARRHKPVSGQKAMDSTPNPRQVRAAWYSLVTKGPNTHALDVISRTGDLPQWLKNMFAREAAKRRAHHRENKP